MRGWRPGSLLFFPQERSGQEFTWSCAPRQGIFTFAKWYCLVYWCQKAQLNKTSLLRSNPPSSFQLDLLFFQSRLWLGFFWCIYIPVCPRVSSRVLPLLGLVKHRVSSQMCLPMPALKATQEELFGNQVSLMKPLNVKGEHRGGPLALEHFPDFRQHLL